MKKKKIIVFILIWFLIQICVAGIFSLKTIVFSPLQLTRTECVEWNYECSSTCELTDPIDCSCCKKSQSIFVNKLKFYLGIVGVGLGIFISGILTDLLYKKTKL